MDQHAGAGKGKGSKVVVAGRGRALTIDDKVDLAVAEIGQLGRVTAMQLALGIGEIVLKRIFGGDVELMRRNGPKDVSFARLVMHPELGMSASGLWRAVATYELSLRYPQLVDSRHLGVSHVREVLGLPPSVQEKLLHRAEKERWSVTELAARAAKNRTGQGGRPKKLEILRALDTLRRVATLPVDHFADRRLATKLTAEEAEVHLVTLAELGDRFEELRRLLHDVVARG